MKPLRCGSPVMHPTRLVMRLDKKCASLREAKDYRMWLLDTMKEMGFEREEFTFEIEKDKVL